MMKILHVVKTSHGARWAALQAGVLTRLGLDVHVVLPTDKGEAIAYWQSAQATMHIGDFSLPLGQPQAFSAKKRLIRELVEAVQPDIIHSHFVTTTMMLRLALGRNHPIPRIFQVPGPLHMEHALYRYAETSLAGNSDYWVASSRYTGCLYARHGVAADKLFLSYYGFDIKDLVSDSQSLMHARYNLPPHVKLVGNINYMYPPKFFLGQKHGLKRHEDVIDALALVTRQRDDVIGVLVGGQWGDGSSYEAKLRRRAQVKAGDKILFAGRVPAQEALKMWHDFDCAIHVPHSENCGGVVEPLAARVPTIASDVGGLPEVVLDGLTGWIVPVGQPHILADRVQAVLADRETAQKRAQAGQKLVHHMFDVNRTGAEIAHIYAYLLGLSAEKPQPFDAHAYIASTG
jgi:glycosyltransferase involved in cell wall biosynthesis